MKIFNFRCKNCGSKNTVKKVLLFTPIVENFCTKKKMDATNKSFKEKIYICNDCCCVSEKHNYIIDSFWESSNMNFKKYLLAFDEKFKIKVVK